MKRNYGFKCAWCKKRKKLTVDHIKPISKGGQHEKANIQPLCKNCNSKKQEILLLSSMQQPKEFKKWVVWTAFGDGGPVAYRLQKENKDVILAVVHDLKSVHSEEGPEEKRRRLQNYDGVVPKIAAEKLLERLAKVKNKDEWFHFFDLNCLYKYSQAVLKMGFRNGNFFLKQDYLLESDREMAKKLVQAHYPGLKVAPVHEFKSVEDALKFLEEDKGNRWALKGDQDHGAETIVPVIDDEQMAKEEVAEALTMNKQAYESGGFILEMIIPEPIEITPAGFFYDGELVFGDIDLENKNIGSGNIGYQVGAAQSLIMGLEEGSVLQKAALPEAAFKMAKKHVGMFNIDASILMDRRDGSMYFGEFCTRPGYDALFAEIAMSRSCSGFFEDLANGKNPLIRDYGAAVRIFNLPKKAPYLFDKKKPDLNAKRINWKTDEFLYPFDLVKKDGRKETSGYSTDVCVAVGYGKTPQDAISMAHSEADQYSLKAAYYRPEEDFRGHYPTSILEAHEKALPISKKEKIDLNEHGPNA